MSAADRFARYLAVREAVKMIGIDDVIHAVHTGTEHEAELRLSDLRTLAARLAALESEMWELLHSATSHLHVIGQTTQQVDETQWIKRARNVLAGKAQP